MSRRMNIATSLNSQYMRYTCVMLTSLFENQPKDVDIHIYLLQSNLTSEDKFYLQQVVDFYGGTLHLIQMDTAIFPEECPVSECWSLEIYYRLALLDLLPKDVDRLLYLDVDIIVNKSLEDMYFNNFEGNMLCACADIPFTAHFNSKWNIFNDFLEKGMTYFNSGVMLLNIEAMRGKYSLKDYLEVAQKLNYNLVAPDQDLLNYVHWNEVKLLNENVYDLFAKVAYNYDIHYEEVKEQVAIIHFAGDKPWHGNSVHYDIEQLWWDYAKKTPFYVEFMEEFVTKAVNDSEIYDAIKRMGDEKKALKEELDKSVSLCQKLLQMVQGK